MFPYCRKSLCRVCRVCLGNLRLDHLAPALALPYLVPVPPLASTECVLLLCKVTTECVLLLQNVFSFHCLTRCLSLHLRGTMQRTTECVLLLQNVFSFHCLTWCLSLHLRGTMQSHYRMCSLTTECVLLLQKVTTECVLLL